MRLLKNHCWCSKSNWEDSHYDCQYILSIDEEGGDNILVYEKTDNLDPNWKHVEAMLRKDYPKEKLGDLDKLKQTYYNSAYNLKPEVIQWLVDNIEDTKNGKGWCIGNEDYRINDGGSFPIFFQRKSDVFKFVKRWSKCGRLEVDYNYFTGVRRVWNKELGKYLVEGKNNGQA